MKKSKKEPVWIWEMSQEPVQESIIRPWTDFKPLGFVYKITRLSDGKFYIGKKLFWFKKRTKVKGKRDKLSLVESDWKTYYGSSNDLIADVAKLGKTAFKREIVGVFQNKWDMSYHELKEQLKYDVMNPEVNTYNGIINVRLRKRSW